MRPRTAQIVATGTIAGLIGFAAVSIGFGLLDLAGGRGLGFTPSLLGGALFLGPVEACDVQVSSLLAVGYSALHLVVFLALGLLTAWLFALTAARPWFYTGATFLFIIVTFHLYGAVLSLLAPVRGCFSLYHILGATALAAAAMVAYLVRQNRGILEAVSRPENQ